METVAGKLLLVRCPVCSLKPRSLLPRYLLGLEKDLPRCHLLIDLLLP